MGKNYKPDDEDHVLQELLHDEHLQEAEAKQSIKEQSKEEEDLHEVSNVVIEKASIDQYNIDLGIDQTNYWYRAKSKIKNLFKEFAILNERARKKFRDSVAVMYPDLHKMYKHTGMGRSRFLGELRRIARVRENTIRAQRLFVSRSYQRLRNIKNIQHSNDYSKNLKKAIDATHKSQIIHKAANVGRANNRFANVIMQQRAGQSWQANRMQNNALNRNNINMHRNNASTFKSWNLHEGHSENRLATQQHVSGQDFTKTNNPVYSMKQQLIPNNVYASGGAGQARSSGGMGVLALLLGAGASIVKGDFKMSSRAISDAASLGNNLAKGATAASITFKNEQSTSPTFLNAGLRNNVSDIRMSKMPSSQPLLSVSQSNFVSSYGNVSFSSIRFRSSDMTGPSCNVNIVSSDPVALNNNQGISR